MISQTLTDTETSTLPTEPWIAPWAALREYQEHVADFWLAAFSGWPYLFPGLRGTRQIDLILPQQESSTDLGRPDGASEADWVARAEEVIGRMQPKDQANDAESESTETDREAPGQAEPERPPHAVKPARKRASRPAARDQKEIERTGPGVLEGLRHRSHNVKMAAVSAMATNKKLRTQGAIPLLERIVDNDTIQRRAPELRTAAKKVLQQTRREGASRRTEAAQNRSTARSKSRRRAAKA